MIGICKSYRQFCWKTRRYKLWIFYNLVILTVFKEKAKIFGGQISIPPLLPLSSTHSLSHSSIWRKNIQYQILCLFYSITLNVFNLPVFSLLKQVFYKRIFRYLHANSTMDKGLIKDFLWTPLVQRQTMMLELQEWILG